MPEQLDLTTPVVRPSVTSFRVGSVYLQYMPSAHIVITLIGSDGTEKVQTYSRELALPLLRALNILAPGSGSLHRRILEHLVNDGVLSGTVSGTPDRPDM